MSFLSTAVQSVLEQGEYCHVATSTPKGPHCTPLVFAYSGGRLWLTTSRRSVKTRAWKVDPSAAGIVRHGGLTAAFTGTVKLYDALDRGTWGAAVAGATSIARATAAFSKKNARFFAGYAFDAKQVPFAWTPPGRVFVGIDLDRTALVDTDGVQEGRGRWGGTSTSHAAFRRTAKGADPLAALPDEVEGPLGREGEGALALVGDRGPVVVPTRWRAEEHAIYAALPGETLALAAAGPDVPAALTIDEPSAWRARDMVGAMVQATASVYVLDELGGGPKIARALATGIDPDADALVRLAPSRLVWWRGWSSGSVDIG
ncbi:MAG TPA: pyridoxamine 5'-phosphate oxidase family protein [Actinomycetota bacterium]|nr:pyridoxamine 5'-phosphate oxidase family protein [Actinomycetota bacterium]